MHACMHDAMISVWHGMEMHYSITQLDLTTGLGHALESMVYDVIASPPSCIKMRVAMSCSWDRFISACATGNAAQINPMEGLSGGIVSSDGH